MSLQFVYPSIADTTWFPRAPTGEIQEEKPWIHQRAEASDHWGEDPNEA